MPSSVLAINASQPQHTPAGSVLGHMYYRGFLEKVLSRDEYSGYPHNGGMHSLTLYLSKEDAHAFLDLAKTHFARYPEEVEAFVASVLNALPNARTVTRH